MKIKINFQGMETLFAELPSREKQVIHLLVSGNDNAKQIAKLTTELVSIIKFLCKKLNWIESEEEPRYGISHGNEQESDEGLLTDTSVTDELEENQESDRNSVSFKAEDIVDSDTFADLLANEHLTTEDKLKKEDFDPYYGIKKLPLSCSFCDKTFGAKRNLMYHERVHTNEKPFGCPECNKTFSRLDMLKRHQKLHSVKKFACSICEKQFLDLQTLEIHENKHTGEKAFTCSSCEKKFSNASHLKRHERIHTGDLFSCLQCDKRFTRIERLKSHERIHTGDLFDCHQCDKKFSRRDHLKKHERIHNFDNSTWTQKGLHHA